MLNHFCCRCGWNAYLAPANLMNLHRSKWIGVLSSPTVCQTTTAASYAHQTLLLRLRPIEVNHNEKIKMQLAHNGIMEIDFFSPSSSNWLLCWWWSLPRSRLVDATISRKMSTPAYSISASMQCKLISVANFERTKDQLKISVSTRKFTNDCCTVVPHSISMVVRVQSMVRQYLPHYQSHPHTKCIYRKN